MFYYKQNDHKASLKIDSSYDFIVIPRQRVTCIGSGPDIVYDVVCVSGGDQIQLLVVVGDAGEDHQSYCMQVNLVGATFAYTSSRPSTRKVVKEPTSRFTLVETDSEDHPEHPEPRRSSASVRTRTYPRRPITDASGIANCYAQGLGPD